MHILPKASPLHEPSSKGSPSRRFEVQQVGPLHLPLVGSLSLMSQPRHYQYLELRMVSETHLSPGNIY